MELNSPAREIMTNCMKKGLLIIGAGTHIMRFVPTLIISKENVNEAIKIIDEVLGDSNE